MTNYYCGLDFGTSNSTLGVFHQGQARLLPLEKNGNPAMRSAIFLNEHDRNIKFGKSAVEDYLAHEEGRLLMAIKSVLGSALMEEKTRVFNQMLPFTEVLGFFIKHLKQNAEQQIGQPLDCVVMGRPVHFDDSDAEADQRAQDTLEKIAKQQGFKQVLFQFEPIAAANAFRQTNPNGALALIVDIGGGTSDFTLLKIGQQANHNADDILASAGVHIGGTDIDRLISLKKVMPLLGMGSEMTTFSGQVLPLPGATYHDLSTWHRINPLYSNKEMSSIRDLLKYAKDKARTNRLLTVLENRDGHRILECCEAHKIELSDQSEVALDLDFIEDNLTEAFSQNELAGLIQQEVEKILTTIRDMLQSCGLQADQVDTVFFTGGTSKLPYIQQQVLQQLPNAHAVNGDAFGSVGLGLTIEAGQRFGLGM